MGVTDFVSEKMAVEKCLNFDKSVIRMQVSSIEGRFDRRSFRSTKVDSIEARVSSIEDCNYCLSVLNLLFMKSVEKYFMIQLTHS